MSKFPLLFSSLAVPPSFCLWNEHIIDLNRSKFSIQSTETYISESIAPHFHDIGGFQRVEMLQELFQEITRFFQ